MKGALRAGARISSQSLVVEMPGWQGAKAQEYMDIPSLRNAVRRAGSAAGMGAYFLSAPLVSTTDHLQVSLETVPEKELVIDANPAKVATPAPRPSGFA